MIPVAIGKNSANEVYHIDLTQLPHLFISYTTGEQISRFFASLTSALNGGDSPVHFAIASTRRSAGQAVPAPGVVVHRFSAHDEEGSTVASREQFMLALSKEMRLRSAWLEKEKGGTTTRKPFPHMVILLHDIFDIILSNKKSIALSFIKLLLLGKMLRMHVVAASAFTYRNLLKQLIQLNPLVREKFKSFFDSGAYPVVTPLGAELVITAEDLLFFKPANAIDYERLYPLEEKAAEGDDLIATMFTEQVEGLAVAG